MAKKFYVFDTSVCLTDFNSVYSYGNNDIVIPFKVLDEIDNHKQRQDGVGRNARETIRILDSLREAGSLNKGVRLGKGMGVIKVIPYITSLYSFTTVYITLCIIRFITIEYKRYSREGIDRSTGVSYTDKLTDDLVMITVSKIILLLKYIVAFGILFIIKEFLG